MVEDSLLKNSESGVKRKAFKGSSLLTRLNRMVVDYTQFSVKTKS